MKLGWKYFWAIPVVLVLGFVAVRLLTGPDPTRQVVLPDGRQITLRALTLGTNASYVAGNLFQRTVGPMLPARLKAEFKVRQLRAAIDPTLRGTIPLTVWIEVPTVNLIVRIADDDGWEQVAAHANASGAMLPSGGWITAHVFTSWPRSSRRLRVRVYAMEGGLIKQLAEFRADNPAHRKYPSERKPERLPIRQETNGIHFTVTEFNTGLYATGHVANMASNWTEIVYETDAGPWRPMLVTVTDASGNRILQRQPMQRMMTAALPPGTAMTFDPSRQGVISLPAMLWLDEPAWTVHLEMERFQRNSFRTDEWWEIKDLAVPAPGETAELNLLSPKEGENAIFKSIAVLDTGARRGGRRVRIELQPSPASGVLMTPLQITDERGASVHFVANNAGRKFVNEYLLDAAAADAKALNVRIAVHHRLIMDFLAKPALLRTNITKDP